MFLSAEEKVALTGFKRPSAQIRWLNQNGYRVTVNGLGEPVVAVAEVNRRLVGGRTVAREPNFEALSHGSQAQNG